MDKHVIGITGERSFFIDEEYFSEGQAIAYLVSTYGCYEDECILYLAHLVQLSGTDNFLNSLKYNGGK